MLIWHCWICNSRSSKVCPRGSALANLPPRACFLASSFAGLSSQVYLYILSKTSTNQLYRLIKLILFKIFIDLDCSSSAEHNSSEINCLRSRAFDEFWLSRFLLACKCMRNSFANFAIPFCRNSSNRLTRNRKSGLLLKTLLNEKSFHWNGLSSPGNTSFRTGLFESFRMKSSPLENTQKFVQTKI